MNVAFISEDASDTEVVGTLVERLLERRTTRTHFMTGVGFGAVMKAARPLTISAARARADLVVVIVDCDGTVDHFAPASLPPHDKCRHCELSAKVPPVHEIAKLSEHQSTVVIGLAVRTLESWLGVAAGVQIPGSILEFGREAHQRRELKALVYGAETSRESMITRGVAIASHADLPALEKALPSFAAFARSVRATPVS